MGWKNWSYWLRGAVIGIIASIVVFFLGWNMPSCWNFGTQQTPAYCHLLFPINGTIGGAPGIISILLYIVYGAIIGWIVGKIKSK